MNLLTYFGHLVGSGAMAYLMARLIRDPLTRPTVLAGFQLAESGSVPFLEALSQRAEAEGKTWLAEKLAKHAADETRHGKIFAHALKQLNKQVIDVGTKRATQTQTDNAQPSSERQDPFFGTYFEGYTAEQLKPATISWPVFMASTYILELDASQDFARMAKVLPDHEPTSQNLKKGLLSIAADETTHAAYLYEAMTRSMSMVEVQNQIDTWRTRKVNALMAAVGNFLQRRGEMRSLVQEGVPPASETTVEASEPQAPEPTIV